MKISVILNSYNYANYIGQAIESVFAQTLPADEVIIVDDGSTDSSCEVIRKYAEKYERIKFIAKANGGQLSAFNEAAKHVTGDIVFFLDSDDAWQPEYIETIMGIYRREPTDFVFCALQNFGSDNGLRRAYRTSRDLGYTAALTFYMKTFIGSQTSSISIRKEILDKIYPVPHEKEWRVSADFSLVAGASVLGARKYYCAEPLVLYRMHNENAHKIQKAKDEYKFKTLYKRSAQVQYFAARSNLTAADFDRLLDLEITTRQNAMDKKTFLRYLRIIFYTERNFLWKVYELAKLAYVNAALAMKDRRH